jgi:hypothetical protein
MDSDGRSVRVNALSPRKPMLDSTLLESFFHNVDPEDGNAGLEHKKVVNNPKPKPKDLEDLIEKNKAKELSLQRDREHKAKLRKEELEAKSKSAIKVPTHSIDTKEVEGKSVKFIFRTQKSPGIPWSSPGQDLNVVKLTTTVKDLKTVLLKKFPDVLNLLSSWDGEDYNSGVQQDNLGRYYLLSIKIIQ